MAAITGNEAKELYSGDVLVPIPGLEGKEWICRRPEIADLMLRGVVPMPLVKLIVNELGGGTGENLKTPEEIVKSGAVGMLAFVDQWVVMAAKSPAVAPTPKEAAEQNAIWVRDIPLDVRMAIFKATYRASNARRVEAAAEFRGGGLGTSDRPDGAAVSPAPVDAAGADGRG